MNRFQASLAAALMIGTFLAVLTLGARAGYPWIGLGTGVVAAFAAGRAYVGQFDDPWVYARDEEGR